MVIARPNPFYLLSHKTLQCPCYPAPTDMISPAPTGMINPAPTGMINPTPAVDQPIPNILTLAPTFAGGACFRHTRLNDISHTPLNSWIHAEVRSCQIWGHTPEQRVAASTLRRYSLGLCLAIAQADARLFMPVSFR